MSCSKMVFGYVLLFVVECGLFLEYESVLVYC